MSTAASLTTLLLLSVIIFPTAYASCPYELSCPSYQPENPYCCPMNSTCCGLYSGACCPEGTICCTSNLGVFSGCCAGDELCNGQNGCEPQQPTEKSAYILVQVVGLIFILAALAWCCTWCRRQQRNSQNEVVIYPGIPPPNYGAIPSAMPKGVPPQIISQITVVQYKPGVFEENMYDRNLKLLFMCTVCLGDYVEGEDVRVLPCRHNFHSLCIEKWFREHQTCPLCVRAVVVWK